MKLQNQALLLRASDLVGHLNCRQLTHLEVEAANGRIKRPHYDNPSLQLLFERGVSNTSFRSKPGSTRATATSTTHAPLLLRVLSSRNRSH
jgi:hypothetical protein